MADRLLIPGWGRALDSDGFPIAASISLFLTGTDALAPVYADEGLTTPLTNPVPSNSAGRFPAIWADESAAYDWSVVAPYGPPGSPFTGTGLTTASAADVLAAEAAEAAADAAAISSGEASNAASQAEAARQDVIDAIANAPESVPNKANIQGDNIANLGLQATFRNNIGAVGTAILASTDGGELVGTRVNGTGAVLRTQQSKNRDFISVGDFGAVTGTGSDASAAINAALAAHNEVNVPAGVYRCDAMITVPDGKSLKLAKGAVLRRYSAYSAATTPVVFVQGSNSRFSGGELRTENNHPDGIALLGHRDTTSAYNANYWRFSDCDLYGVKAAGNVGIKVTSSQPYLGDAYANYFGSIQTVKIVGADIAVQFLEMANGHEVRDVSMENVGTYFYHLRGAYENKAFGGFCHGGGTTNGAICVRLEDATTMTPEHQSECNQFIGIGMEPGGALTKSYDIDAGCSKNILIIVDNVGGGGEDRDGGNYIRTTFNQTTYPNNRQTNIPGPITHNVSIRKSKRYQLADTSANHNVFTTTLSGTDDARNVRVTATLRNNNLHRTAVIDEMWALRNTNGTLTATKIGGGTSAQDAGDGFNFTISSLTATGRIATFNQGSGFINYVSVSVEVFTDSPSVDADLVML